MMTEQLAKSYAEQYLGGSYIPIFQDDSMNDKIREQIFKTKRANEQKRKKSNCSL